MAKKDEEGVVRKAVFVPATLWQQLRVEAAQRDIDLSDIITEMLRDRYERAVQLTSGSAGDAR
jgi:macrodomain Ter protein organizer (MatP/YcbG family)